ncbi:hypothetical protein TRIP_B250054 [uncultured Desulfatiglans sp.]|nr:hypothetical protein TRIP_B250054 [uncultured Desulfatiglans sp.]
MRWNENGFLKWDHGLRWYPLERGKIGSFHVNGSGCGDNAVTMAPNEPSRRRRHWTLTGPEGRGFYPGPKKREEGSYGIP